MAILLTGGAGFIGSHTAVACLNAGVEVVLADNFSNSSPKVLDRIEKISGKRPALYNVDVCDKQALRGIFAEQMCIRDSDSAGNSQVQLAAEGDNAVLLGRLPVRGLSFLCVLDSVSVQSVQKDLSSLFTGQVMLGLPAVSQIVDQADLDVYKRQELHRFYRR